MTNVTTIYEELIAGLDLDELKTLKGYSRYQFDLREARIFDVRSGNEIKNKPNARGYTYVSIEPDNGGERLVIGLHVLMITVALEGFDFRKLNLVVDHIDRDRTNNKFENLRLITYSENAMNRTNTGRARLTADKVEELEKDFNSILSMEHGAKHDTYKRLSEKYGLKPHTIQIRYLDYKRKLA